MVGHYVKYVNLCQFCITQESYFSLWINGSQLCQHVENHWGCFVLFFNRFIYFIYLFLAVLGLRCYVQAFSSCSEWGLLFVAVHRLLIAVVSFVAEHRL